MSGATFHDPYWLLLLLLLPVIAWLRRRRSVPALVVPGAHEWHSPGATSSALWPIVCAYVGIALLVGGLARPQVFVPLDDHQRRGYDLIIAIDLSTSMYAEDFQRGATTVNRLQAVKPIISAFINERPDDRIGIVVFGGRAYTFAPLTFDHEWLRKQSARLSIGLIEDGTAIGDAIGVALRRLREGRAEEQGRHGSFIVLLTDGSSNKGSLDPRQAARLAADEGVAIYTIGAGAEGLVPVPVFDYAGNRTGTEMRASEIDSLLLRDVAESTDGLFFRATDANAVRDAFARIDEAQKVEFAAAPPLVSRELFHVFALMGVGLLALAWYEAHFRAARAERDMSSNLKLSTTTTHTGIEP
ncbi:VWA domain-containing protein [Steroidobacter sp. S1-65]|uniref:VWA domain-containing protein n=1 Tax=Steroidobacter gossypii TaxID=2805490 RepID=A0ABS1X071_9GAMM|nr:VWA domain-containing protein [Steroidobacter gossypii]